MKKIEMLFKGYACNKRDIERLKRRKELLPHTKTLVGIQVLSFTPVCHSGESKTERQAFEILENKEVLDAMIKDRECAVARVDDIIDSFKQDKEHLYNLFHLKVRRGKRFEDCLEMIGYYYSLETLKSAYYRTLDKLEEEELQLHEDIEHKIFGEQ